MAKKPVDREAAELMDALVAFGERLDKAADAVGGAEKLAKKKFKLPAAGAELDDELPELSDGVK